MSFEQNDPIAKTSNQKVMITRLAGVSGQPDLSTGENVLILEFEVPNPNDLFQLTITYDPKEIKVLQDLQDLFDLSRDRIAPICHTIWDEAVDTFMNMQ